MSDIVKWGLLAAGAVALVALIVALPFVDFINVGELGSLIGRLVDLVGGAFTSARGLVNNFLTPFGPDVLTGIMLYLHAKWVITLSIKITAWIYHFIFKG